MEASAGVLRRFPSIAGAGAGVSTNQFHRTSKFSCSCSNSSILSLNSSVMGKQESGVKLKSRKLMGSGFYDEGCLEYYSSGRGGRIWCGKKEKTKENDVSLKKTKKKMKLLKGLSRDLSNLTEMGFGFGSDIALVDQVQGKTISEAADLLLGQLQQLKAEEKELKRKRKEEKALVKMKAASQVQGTRNRVMSSSSSSSSESSDDECQNMVDIKSMKIESLAQTIPEACDRALENARLSSALSTVVEPQILNPQADTSVEISNTSSTSTDETTGRTTSLEVPVPEQKVECCLEASDCHIDSVGSSSNASIAAAATKIKISNTSSSSTDETTGRTTNLEVLLPEQKGECCLEASDCHIDSVGSRSNASVAAAGTKRIEVCMGGKCKRSGAGAILEEFQRVVGIEAAVSGCKCMGKCKVGPNVRVSGCSSSSSSSDAFQAGDSVAVSSAPTTSNSLCVGVGLEDVSLIAANLLGRYQEVGLANAVPC